MKLTKIFYGNQYVSKFNCDGKRYTKWQIFKIKTKNFFKKVLKLLILAGIIYAIIYVFFPCYKEVDKIIKVDNLATKVETLKGEVLDTLRTCESSGASEADGLLVYDSNKQVSIGLYQFQKKTVIYYYKTLYGKEINGKEAIEIALDYDLSRKLANDIIFTEKNGKGIDNWLNCKNKNGLAENIKWINKIL